MWFSASLTESNVLCTEWENPIWLYQEPVLYLYGSFIKFAALNCTAYLYGTQRESEMVLVQCGKQTD